MRATMTRSASASCWRCSGPAPAGWVQAAQELPSARRELDEIVARAEADQAFREALIADLEQTLAREGYEPRAAGARRAAPRCTGRADLPVGSRPEPRRRRARGRARRGVFGAARVEPAEGRRRTHRARRRSGRSASRASGPGAARRGREYASASSTPASTRGIRRSGSSRAPSRSRRRDDEKVIVEEDREGDLCGHGTACAGIVRSIAPECSLSSVRVLGAGFTGTGPVLLAGLRYAVEQGFDVINMSLSTTKKQFAGDAPRARGQRVLQALGARGVRAQHARRELSVEVLVRASRSAVTRRRIR